MSDIESHKFDAARDKADRDDAADRICERNELHIFMEEVATEAANMILARAGQRFEKSLVSLDVASLQANIHDGIGDAVVLRDD